MNLRNFTADLHSVQVIGDVSTALFPTSSGSDRGLLGLLPQPLNVDGGAGWEDEVAAAVDEAEALEVCDRVARGKRHTRPARASHVESSF